MMHRLSFMLFHLYVTCSSCFQIPSINTRSNIASVSKSVPINERSQQCSPFRSLMTLYNSNNSEDQEEPEEIKSNGDVFDKIWESSYFSSFLFWIPFIANERLRNRFTNFLSEHFDLSTVIPLSLVGITSTAAYVSYKNKMSEIELANSATNESIRQLREIRKSQMTASVEKNLENDYQQALKNYEYLLRKELRSRNTFVMLPLKIPNKVEGPDKSVAKQFLGMEINESGDLVP